MGCFGFCKENDAYTTADKGIFMQTNPNGGKSPLPFFTIFYLRFIQVIVII